MYELPTSIFIKDKEYAIRNRGDFRMVIDCFLALEDEELSREERAYASLIIFFEDVNSIEDVNNIPDIEQAYVEMMRFFNCGRSESSGMTTPYKLIDWDKDSVMVCSAINKVAGMEIRSVDYMHWWTFIGYYMAVGRSSLSTVVSIRYKIASNKKLEDYERTFKRDNPQYFSWDMRTISQKEEDKELRELWNSTPS